MKTIQASVLPKTEPPVIVRRADFAQLRLAAERVAQGAADVSEVIRLVSLIEARRHATEWDEQDAQVPMGSYAGDERGYFRIWNFAPDLRDKPDVPAWRNLWGDDRNGVIVHDQPPVLAAQMARLESLGIATSQSWDRWKDAPLKFFCVMDPTYLGSITTASLAVETLEGSPGGAWIISGPDQRRVAWVKTAYNADIMASCVNMAIELEQEVARYGVSGNASFPAEIGRSGLVGLIRWLRRSIEPGERWEQEPPEEVRAMGVELEQLLVKFIEASRAHRYNKRREDREGA